ncbi:Nudix hydrolase domain-containing protein [Plasmodiophora brassicae]
MLLIQRAVRSSDPWSGQLAFPGGKANGKETLLETALRETKEETAVDLGDSHTFQMAGSLGSVDRDRLTIHAFVFLQHERTGSPALHLAGDEVAHACWVPFRHFLEASVDHRRYSMAPYLKRHRMGVLVDAVDFLTNGNAHSTLSFPSVPVECDSITNHLWGLSLQFVSAIIRRGGHPARAAQLTPSAAVRCILALRTTYTRLITVSR